MTMMYWFYLCLLKNSAQLSNWWNWLRGIKALRGEGFFVKSLKSSGHRPQTKNKCLVIWSWLERAQIHATAPHAWTIQDQAKVKFTRWVFVLAVIRIVRLCHIRSHYLAMHWSCCTKSTNFNQHSLGSLWWIISSMTMLPFHSAKRCLTFCELQLPTKRIFNLWYCWYCTMGAVYIPIWIWPTPGHQDDFVTKAFISHGTCTLSCWQKDWVEWEGDPEPLTSLTSCSFLFLRQLQGAFCD